MNNEILTNQNYTLFCAKHYNSPLLSMKDFREDLNRIKYIRKLITRYVQSGELRERLILNHLITLNNVFGADVLVKILFLKLHDQMQYIKPFLILLNICPEIVINIEKQGNIIRVDDIPLDAKIVEALRRL